MDDSPVTGPLARAFPSLCCDVPVPEAARLGCQQHLVFMSRQHEDRLYGIVKHIYLQSNWRHPFNYLRL